MSDYKKKQMTKAQLWDKLHKEREMWTNKCQHDVAVAKINTAITIRKLVDPILAKVTLAFGKPDEDGEYKLDIEIPEAKEGFEWQVTLEEVDEKTWRITTKEVELPKEEEETTISLEEVRERMKDSFEEWEKLENLDLDALDVQADVLQGEVKEEE